jgi:drug/metabolite transporter (DMT)-like permease
MKGYHTNFFEKNPSAYGFIALLLWSFSALFATFMKNIPVFEMLSIVFFISCMSIFLKIFKNKEWYKLKQPLPVTLVGVTAIFGNDAFYFEAFKHAPSAQVDLINYLWPVFVVILLGLFTKEEIKLRKIIGCLISFLGVYILIFHDKSTPFRIIYLSGYLYALCDAVIWSVYMLMCRRHRQLHSEVIGLYCGISMIISFLLHLSTETFISPTLIQWLSMLAIGIFAQGMAYVLWEEGIKKGNYILLSTSSYFIPIFSIVILIIFAKANYSHALIAATLCVAAGAIISR